MSKKNIIVTGGLGFIGSNLIGMLIQQNYNVINIDKVSYSSNFYNTKNFSKNKRYKFIKCNLEDKKKLNKIILKFNLIKSSKNIEHDLSSTMKFFPFSFEISLGSLSISKN